MKQSLMSAAAMSLCGLLAWMPAHAANLEKLQKFQATGTSMDMETVDQGGKAADQIRENLKRIKMPAGFKIDLYAQVPDARHMAVGTNVGVVFVGTRKTKVWAVTDRDKDRVADEVKIFAPSIDMTIPNGVCFSKDGFLFIAEQNRVLVYPAAEFFYEGPDVAAFYVVEDGKLIPPAEESYNHTARVCRIGPDDKLYISLGQPFNVFAPEKMDLYAETGIGGIIRMNRDGSGREVYATGVRNSVGIEFNPANDELWFTDNQVDGMGDLIPPGELNKVSAKGENFGFPWYGGGSTRTNEYKDSEPPADAVIAAGRDGRPCGRPRAQVLHRQDVPGEVPWRPVLGPARIVEPHRPRSARGSCSPRSTPTATPREPKSSPRAGSTRAPASTSAGRSTWRNCPTARSWSPTTWPVRSTGSGTTAERRSNGRHPGAAAPGCPTSEETVHESCRACLRAAGAFSPCPATPPIRPRAARRPPSARPVTASTGSPASRRCRISPAKARSI